MGVSGAVDGRQGHLSLHSLYAPGRLGSFGWYTLRALESFR
jgi:hypothetical protein